MRPDRQPLGLPLRRVVRAAPLFGLRRGQPRQLIAAARCALALRLCKARNTGYTARNDPATAKLADLGRDMAERQLNPPP
ncbi:MAG: hypothetical protein ACRDNF_12830 [Streptosporangiaceae bacterium]